VVGLSTATGRLLDRCGKQLAGGPRRWTVTRRRLAISRPPLPIPRRLSFRWNGARKCVVSRDWMVPWGGATAKAHCCTPSGCGSGGTGYLAPATAAPETGPTPGKERAGALGTSGKLRVHCLPSLPPVSHAALCGPTIFHLPTALRSVVDGVAVLLYIICFLHPVLFVRSAL